MTIRYCVAALAGAAALSVASAADALEISNGLSVNGLSVNGLSVNGLSVNGLSVNGLSVNGLSVNGLSVNGLSVNGLSVNGRDMNGWTSQSAAASMQLKAAILQDGSIVTLK